MKKRAVGRRLAGVAGVFLAASVVALADLNTGLVEYYPFDGSATNVLGTGNNGTLSGAVLTTDRFGRQNAAYALDGSGYIAFPSGPPVASTGSFTYAFWMVSTRASDYPVYSPYSWLWFVDRVSETKPLVSLGILTQNYNGGFKGQLWMHVRFDNGSQPPGGWGGVMGGMLTPQEWQHIAMVREYGVSFKLYVNGVLIGSATDNGTSLQPPAVKLGKHAWDGGMGLVGKFDDFRIYNRALSAAEVQELWIGGAQGCYPPPGGLTGWWPGDGNTGELIEGRNCVLTNGASFGPGLVGQAFVLHGTDYAFVPHDPAFNFGTGDFTIVLWANFTSTSGEQVLIAKYIETYGATSPGWAFAKRAGNGLLFGHGGPTAIVESGSLTIPTGTWTCFAVTRSAGLVKLWMNGTVVHSGSLPDALDSDCRLQMGHDDRGLHLKGSIDEVQIFKGRALSDTEIQAIYNAGSAGVCKVLYRQLSSVVVAGPATVAAGIATNYTCTAHFSDGSSADISTLATWSTLGGVPPGTHFSGNSLIGGSAITGDYPITIKATYSSGGETRTATKGVTIRPAFRVTISQQTDYQNPSQYPYGKALLTADVRGASGGVSYQWDLAGANQQGPLNTAQTWASYPARATYQVRVAATDGSRTATGMTFVSVCAPPVTNQPPTQPPPDPAPGYFRNSADPYAPVVFDAGWKSRTNNGLIVITHGLWSAATNTWLTNMAEVIRQRLPGACPNIVLYDWQDEADPVRWRDLIKDVYPDLWESPGIDWVTASPTEVISVADAAADLLSIRFKAPAQGVDLANWIYTNITSGNISSNARVQIIGHSAGGFVAGECGSSLGGLLKTQQVTMLDTPCPYKRHVKKYQQFGKVERYISSAFGLATLDFQTKGSTLVTGDVNLSCKLAGLLCAKGGWVGTTLCTYACNQLFPVPTSAAYHRSLVFESITENWATLFNHDWAYQWYTQSVTNADATDGFYYSPWGGGHPFPTAALSPQEKDGPEPGSEEPVTGFETFGNVTAAGGCYQLTEAADAGIFKELPLPIGAEALKFSYRFTSPGDGDFLGVHWGSNIVLYTGQDVELTRDKYLEAEVPISNFGGQTNTLQFRLVSRGNANASLSLCNIVIVVNPDIDGDGLTNELEVIMGTNPANADSDADGLSDGDEAFIYQTNPLAWDSDGDGLSDAEEVAAGTDPKSAVSVFRITNVQRSPDGSVLLQWASGTNKVYRVNRSLVQSRANYTTLTNGMPSTPPVNSFTDTTATNATAFYWVELQ